jgi:hypothetical protein
MKKEIRTCWKCGAEFELSVADIDFYSSKGWKLPNNCKECRKIKRIEKEKQTTKGENK